MCSCWLLVGLVLLVVVPAATGFGGGAPFKSCVSMSPVHASISKQPAATNAYTLTVESVDEATNTRQVCVKGAKFQGILLQVRVVGDTKPVGTFDVKLPNKTKLMKCSAEADSVTHSKPEDKASPTCFIWKIPDTKFKDHLNAVATIAKDHNTYWENIASNPFSGATAQGVTFATMALCSLLALA